VKHSTVLVRYKPEVAGEARGVRNSLIIALFALHPPRLKNFESLRVGESLKRLMAAAGSALRRDHEDASARSSAHPDFMNGLIDRYVSEYPPVLFGARDADANFWISTRGRQFTIKNMGTLISKITQQTVCVDVSPHLFRMAAASTPTAAIYGSGNPHLAPAVLSHRDERVTDDHYDRSGSLQAGLALADLIAAYRA
jgi:hypothetical protein